MQYIVASMFGIFNFNISDFSIADIFYWLFIAIIIINLLQRRHRDKAEKKRYATLYLAIITLVIYAGTLTIEHYTLSWWFNIPLACIAGVLFYVLRKKIAVFRFRDEKTKKALPLSEILFQDIDSTSEDEQDTV